MIEIKTGNIFDSGADAIVIPVNCRGVAGNGLAYECRRRYPVWNKAYADTCKSGWLRIGRVDVFPYWIQGEGAFAKYLINFPTKEDWKDPSRMEYIEKGLKVLVRVFDGRGIKSIAIPALGCGLGGLRWDDVGPKIMAAFEPLPDVRVMLYPPQ